ncbi:MAG: hypothetical protein ACOY30_11585 [Bacillota bacterium]
MNRTLKTVLRLAGLGLIIFAIASDIPTGWAMALLGVGFAGVIAGGGGG